jgi:hypothetical protein
LLAQVLLKHSASADRCLNDHGVLASVGSVGDAYDNAIAVSFVDSFKTDLVADLICDAPG